MRMLTWMGTALSHFLILNAKKYVTLFFCNRAFETLSDDTEIFRCRLKISDICITVL